ncbi:MAG: glycosyltransferase family 4 protein [Acidimicrobiia bacterium]|nr:glycosyltransferase family 4 protein [Acidimicrobiia bacterium]
MTRPLRVLVLAPYPADCAPGQRFRVEQWLSLLPPGTVEAELRPFFSRRAYDRLYEPGGVPRKAAQSLQGVARRVREVIGLKRWDVAFLYRGAVPLGPPVFEELLARRIPFVYDFDDAIFLDETSPANRAVGRWRQTGNVQEIISRAAATTVGNGWLADYARQYSAHVHVLPTTIDVETYVPAPGPAGGPVCIGWSGSHSTAKHLHTIDGALLEVLRRTTTTLRIIGDSSYRLPGADRLTVLPWRRESELADLRPLDVGVMPLPDDEWSKGKCGFKALLYMAMGVPPVASPVGVNTEIIQHGVNGYLAASEADWVDVLRLLADDAGLRRRVGNVARQTVVERYSGQRWARRFLEVLETAATRSG